MQADEGVIHLLTSQVLNLSKRMVNSLHVCRPSVCAARIDKCHLSRKSTVSTAYSKAHNLPIIIYILDARMCQ